MFQKELKKVIQKEYYNFRKLFWKRLIGFFIISIIGSIFAVVLSPYIIGKEFLIIGSLREVYFVIIVLLFPVFYYFEKWLEMSIV